MKTALFLSFTLPSFSPLICGSRRREDRCRSERKARASAPPAIGGSRRRPRSDEGGAASPARLPRPRLHRRGAKEASKGDEGGAASLARPPSRAAGSSPPAPPLSPTSSPAPEQEEGTAKATSRVDGQTEQPIPSQPRASPLSLCAAGPFPSPWLDAAATRRARAPGGAPVERGRRRSCREARVPRKEKRSPVAMGVPSDEVVQIRQRDAAGDPTVSCPDKTGLGCGLCRVVLLFVLNILKGDMSTDGRWCYIVLWVAATPPRPGRQAMPWDLLKERLVELCPVAARPPPCPESS